MPAVAPTMAGGSSPQQWLASGAVATDLAHTELVILASLSLLAVVQHVPQLLDLRLQRCDLVNIGDNRRKTLVSIVRTEIRLSAYQ